MALSTASFWVEDFIWNSFYAPGRDPEHSRCGDGINGPAFPPGDFVSEAVVVAVMGSAQRHREHTLADSFLAMTDSKGAPVRKLHAGERILHKMKLGDDATTLAKQLTLEIHHML
jgi:hypothetical protein